MRGRRPAEEVHELAALAGVLVAQRGDHAAGRQHRLDALEIAVLVQDPLARPLPEAVQQKVIQIRIVQLRAMAWVVKPSRPRT